MCRMRALPKRSMSYALVLSALRARRGRPLASAATLVALIKSRRRMVMLPSRARRPALANLQVPPALLLGCRLEDRSPGQRLRLLGGLDGLVELAGLAGLLGGGERRC